MNPRFRPHLAELVGTFVVVLIGAGTVCSAYLPGDPRFSLAGGPALAEGLALAVMLSVTFLVSPGCLNPAITLALWVARRIDLGRAAQLITAQLLGAILAGLVVRLLFAEGVLLEARLGTPHLKALLGADGTVTTAGWAAGIGVELACTFVVSLTAFATLFDDRAPRLGGLMVGLAQTAVLLFGFHLTGGAANPARWLGTAVWELTLSQSEIARPLADHVVYWVGPICGALLGCLFYSGMILPGDPATRTKGESWRH